MRISNAGRRLFHYIVLAAQSTTSACYLKPTACDADVGNRHPAASRPTGLRLLLWHGADRYRRACESMLALSAICCTSQKTSPPELGRGYIAMGDLPRAQQMLLRCLSGIHRRRCGRRRERTAADDPPAQIRNELVRSRGAGWRATAINNSGIASDIINVPLFAP